MSSEIERLSVLFKTVKGVSDVSEEKSRILPASLPILLSWSCIFSFMPCHTVRSEWHCLRWGREAARCPGPVTSHPPLPMASSLRGDFIQACIRWNHLNLIFPNCSYFLRLPVNLTIIGNLNLYVLTKHHQNTYASFLKVRQFNRFCDENKSLISAPAPAPRPQRKPFFVVSRLSSSLGDMGNSR